MLVDHLDSIDLKTLAMTVAGFIPRDDLKLFKPRRNFTSAVRRDQATFTVTDRPSDRVRY